MPNGKRLWRTAEDDLVPDGHTDARVLAYGVDDELSDEDRGKVRDTEKSEAAVTPKKQASATPKK